jgi:SPP1 family predicted phage head-tail adaptor
MRLDDQVAILDCGTTQDAAGQLTESWTPRPVIWGNVLFQSGAEVMRANVEISVIQVSIRVWSDPSIDTTARVQHINIVYNIKAVLPDSKDRRFMFLVCESVK